MIPSSANIAAIETPAADAPSDAVPRPFRADQRYAGSAYRNSLAQTWVKRGIWAYMILWLIEGGLRRWFLPQLATPLLVVRDPVVLWVYYQASKAVWPRTPFIPIAIVLGIVSWCFAFLAGHGDPIVALYGVRSDFLHVPMIFIMATYLGRDDLEKICRVALWIAIPYTLLLVLQFYSPQRAWVNRGIGGDLEGAGFSGALGRYRPPGTFSFITGVTQLYPMLAGAWFYLLARKKLTTTLLALSAVAILLAIPVSISRGLFIGVVVVALAGCYALVASGALAAKTLLQLVAGGAIVAVIGLSLPATSDALDAFLTRWENSTTRHGGAEEAIVGRLVDTMTNPLQHAPLLGHGTGISTQVGQRLFTGSRGFGYSEGEWGRLLFEGGLLLGSLILLYRVALFAYITQCSFSALTKGRDYALPLWAAAAPLLLLGQWGNSTSLGSAVIAGGLCLAAAIQGQHPARGRVTARNSVYFPHPTTSPSSHEASYQGGN